MYFLKCDQNLENMAHVRKTFLQNIWFRMFDPDDGIQGKFGWCIVDAGMMANFTLCRGGGRHASAIWYRGSASFSSALVTFSRNIVNVCVWGGVGGGVCLHDA